MKLNYKRTVFVGLAFFLIALFWQTYDAIIPKILTDKFGMPHVWSGAIMAFDNILALFMLPLFGALSDKHKGKKGRRTPFIMVGTVIAAIALMGLSFVDNAQLAKLNDISAVSDPNAPGYTEAMETLYDSDVEINVDGVKAPLSSFIEKDEFLGLGYDENEPKKLDEDYTRFVTPARQSYAARVTSENVWILATFIGVLLVALVAMSTFRSPAVALMPDVTPKPLRSKANAVINLMGTLGGILMLLSGKLFGTGATKNVLMSYIPVFAFTAALMIIALIVFRIKVNEPLLVETMKRESADIEEVSVEESEERKLSRAERRSLLFILASVVLWFMGYNAVTTKYSVYATEVLGLDFNTTLMIASATALVAFIPVGIIASKIGRKKTVLAGVIMLFTAFVGAIFVKQGTSIIIVNLLFSLAGIGWATINVNSYPMVVELSQGSNVGKYTGYYYTASMAAQTATPVLSGILFDAFGIRNVFFPYAAIFVGLAFVTMCFVKHGDSKTIAAKSKLEAFDVD